MSGGVDSSIGAALLAEAGWDVTGVTLKLWCYGTSPVSPRACCTLDAIDDARAVASTRGFPHFVVDAEDVFRARVLQLSKMMSRQSDEAFRKSLDGKSADYVIQVLNDLLPTTQ
jgi:tRNA U34 2-thiouridine synthase MnmA/TrmU